MAKIHSIPPFPADIDRDSFGNWLSGFVDGEGCFQLYVAKDRYKTPHARFAIVLRQDDRQILDLIQSYWACGGILSRVSHKRSINPCVHYQVQRASDLAHLVAHFDKYPLRAKKAQDFLVWKRAVLLWNKIVAQPKKNKGSRWKESQRHEFDTLLVTLRSQRKFVTLPTSGI